MVSVSRTISLAALIAVVPGARGAELPLQGSYQADIWGTVELSTEGERLVGRASKGNPCGLEPGTPVLDGTLQGRVLVGQFELCLQGEGCPERQSLPVLGFHSPEEGSLTAYVRIQQGCLSPVLGQEGLVVLRSPRAVSAAQEAAAAARASLMSGRGASRRNPEAAKAALERGEQLLREKKWGGSVAEFERSIALGEQSWVAFFGLGTAQLMRNQLPEAVEMLSRAQKLNKREPNIAYTLACAYSRLGKKDQALLFLEQAVKSGYAIKAGSQDLGLEKLLLSDPGSIARYTENIQEAFKNAEAPARRRQAQGP
ncbi:tetratricopeptide repeat domain protein [Cystobacter fuscus DSM 2262]|uniref:Tetratricopeptide repeat domain protein n=1 Tax=Cystobacter fuscus (strain ATCC 25194 / DSM 2262 / NBRC 100088 / M29) TaxID=1242864 RepID=S9NX95_CYSF2|nr:tetratricopeptide repeat protein [Cystobacter fuscus]EPX55506.1 tetratricopeptide repeat domain protein [Cystobacter fuscus DSM 2262]